MKRKLNEYHIVRPAPWMRKPYIRRKPYTYRYPTKRQQVIRGLFAKAAYDVFDSKGYVYQGKKPLPVAAAAVKKLVKPLPPVERVIEMDEKAFRKLKKQEFLLKMSGEDVSLEDIVKTYKIKLVIKKVREIIKKVS